MFSIAECHEDEPEVFRRVHRCFLMGNSLGSKYKGDALDVMLFLSVLEGSSAPGEEMKLVLISVAVAWESEVFLCVDKTGPGNSRIHL